MKHRELRLKVCERNLKEISYDTLIENYYFEEQPRNITIKFCSPTAFKSQGNYIFMPTVRLIFQSLIHKYDTFSSGTMVGSFKKREFFVRRSKNTSVCWDDHNASQRSTTTGEFD